MRKYTCFHSRHQLNEQIVCIYVTSIEDKRLTSQCSRHSGHGIVCYLLTIPDNISLKYFPESEQLSSKGVSKTLNYYQQGYVHDIQLHVTFIHLYSLRFDLPSWLTHPLTPALGYYWDGFLSFKGSIPASRRSLWTLKQTLNFYWLFDFAIEQSRPVHRQASYIKLILKIIDNNLMSWRLRQVFHGVAVRLRVEGRMKKIVILILLLA